MGAEALQLPALFPPLTMTVCLPNGVGSGSHEVAGMDAWGQLAASQDADDVDSGEGDSHVTALVSLLGARMDAEEAGLARPRNCIRGR